MIKSLLDYREKIEYNDGVQDAENAIRTKAILVQSISNYDGYKVIKEYWVSRKELAIKRLGSMKASDPLEIKGVQTDLNTANDFISYLDRIETYTE